MFRANLHLHPHPNSQSKLASAPPGAFPIFTSISSSGSDFARTITLTPETSIQPIGRSSRNASKGLVADRNNGFFESAVMSRAHAEVRLILEPTRKIIIKDTKSMHGTFVNGLQLREEETAELRQGTEVTFGCEVTRGEEVFPPKTFRCDIEWEDMTPPKTPNFGITEKGKSRGYGVTTEDITYASGEDFDEEEDEEEEDDEDEDEQVDMSYLDLPPSDEDKASSSGESSSPSSSTSSPVTQNIKPAYVGASTSKPSYFMDEDIPVSHERSTKDMSVEALTKDVERMVQLKKKINEMTSKKDNTVLETNPEFSGMRATGDQRVSIGSLMNKAADPTPHDESEKDGNSGKKSTRKSLPEYGFYTYDLTQSDIEVEVIPKEKFQATAKSSKGSSESKSKQTIVIDDDDDEDMFYDEDELRDCIDIEDDVEQDDDEEEEGQISSEEEEEEEEEEEDGEEDQDMKDFEMKEKENTFRELMNTYGDTANTHSQVEPRPMSPPEVMSSKIPAAPLDSILAPSPSKPSFRSPIEELTHAAVAAMQAPTPPSPSATLPPISKIHHETIIKKTPSGASHIHWLGENNPASKSIPFPTYSDMAQIGIGGMDHKKEYFEAREINSNRARDTRAVNGIHPTRDELALVCPPSFRSASKSPPPPQPYIVDGMPWVHGSKSNEIPKESPGLFPNILESEKTKPIVVLPRTSDEAMPSPPPTVSSQAKRLLEDAVSSSEKNKEAFETRFPSWWQQGEVNFENEEEEEEEEDSDVQWDDEIVHDEDGEYDEEEENEEQHKGSGAEEEDMDDTNLDLDLEEYGDDLECEFGEDDIRTDVSEYGSGSLRNDEAPFLSSQRVFAIASSSVTSSNNSHLGRTSASEAGKCDFSKSRGFSISNLVNENIVTPPRPQVAATGTFYPTRPLISLPCRIVHQSPGQLSTPNHTANVPASPVSQTRKEKSMADLLNPSSPATGSKRKHEEISTILPEEVPESKYPVVEYFDSDIMDETDDDIEPQEEGNKGEEGGQLVLEPSLTEGSQKSDSVPATTTNTAVQVSAAEVKTPGMESEVEDEPARKKARTGSNGQQIARFAATALAGAIVGGVGMFAALVATAP